MRPFSSLAGTLVLALPLGESLRTEYVPGQKVLVERETHLRMETVLLRFERDGREIDRGGRAGGFNSETRKRVAYVDLVRDVEGGAPVRLERTLEVLEGEGTLGTRKVVLEAPLAGKRLLLQSSEDGVRAEPLECVVEDDSLLQGHALSLPIDALLPGAEVARGVEWELEDGEALLEALGLDVDPKYFLAPRAELGGGGRDGDVGRRLDGDERVLLEADWKVTLVLAEETEEHRGEEALVVRLSAEGAGERSTAEGASGRTRTTSTILLRGKLLFSPKSRRPVRFEVEGEIAIESDSEFVRGSSKARMQRWQEGTFEQEVSISER